MARLDAFMVCPQDATCHDDHSPRPNAWAVAHPDQILSYRKDERRDHADRKQLSREERRNAKG